MSGQTLIERLRCIRGRAVEYVEWRKAGFPMTDERDTYPDDLYSAAVRAEAMVPLLDEVLAALSHSPSREPAPEQAATDEVLIAIKRPEDYADVAPELLAEDFIGVRGNGFEWHVVEQEQSLSEKLRDAGPRPEYWNPSSMLGDCRTYEMGNRQRKR